MREALLSISGCSAALTDLRTGWRAVAGAGFLISLISLSLCLGVAVASGFPPMAGYLYTLAAVVISDVLQTLMGFFRAGRLSAFFPTSVVHGMLASFPRVIDSIPLASLAALLVYTGFRLASPEAFAKTMDVDQEKLALFVITIVGVPTTNLRAGTLIGIATKLLRHLGRGVPLKNLLTISYQIHDATPGTCIVRVRGSVIFSNFLALKGALAGLPAGTAVVSTCPTPI